jgi:hypothetical protein
VANRARRSVGGGVLIDFIKLAAMVLAPAVPHIDWGFGTADLGLASVRKACIYQAILEF